MRAYCKRMISRTMAVLLSFTLSVSAYAAPVFSDVPAQSPYYESVAYLVEQGITVGTGNGCYSPDAPITVKQWAVMLCRAFDRTGIAERVGKDFGTSCILEAYRNGWLDYTAILAPDAQVCQAKLLESAFEVIGLSVYDASLYPDRATLSANENILRIGADLGLCQEGAEPLKIMTRAETAVLLHAILTKELQVDPPPILATYPIVNTD